MRRTPPPGSTEDALRRLEQRLDRASEAAERLMAQAAAAAAGGAAGPDAAAGAAAAPGAPAPGAPAPGAAAPGAPAPAPGESADAPGGAGEGNDPLKPPPAGWQIPEDARAGIASDLDPFLTLVQALRDLIPPELQRRLVAALRELLLALRALIDWYLERIERRREESVEVQDIPIL